MHKDEYSITWILVWIRYLAHFELWLCDTIDVNNINEIDTAGVPTNVIKWHVLMISYFILIFLLSFYIIFDINMLTSKRLVVPFLYMNYKYYTRGYKYTRGVGTKIQDVMPF